MHTGTLIYFEDYKPPKARKLKFDIYTILGEHFSEMRSHCKIIQTFNTEEDIKDLEEIINCSEVPIYLISHGLGIIPALYCHYKYDLPLVAINPNYFPAMSLKDVLTEGQLEENKKFKTEIKNAKENRTSFNSKVHIFSALNDEIINGFQKTKFNQIFEDDIESINHSVKGGHKYDVLPDKLTDIQTALGI